MNRLFIAVLIAALVGFAGGHKVAVWENNTEKLKAAKAAVKNLADMTAERDRLSASLTAANDRHAAELRKAQNETNTLRDHLRDGPLGLRIAAVCPDATAQTAGRARVDSGTGAELDETARRAYFALRDGIDQTSAKLAACQDELRLRTAGD